MAAAEREEFDLAVKKGKFVPREQVHLKLAARAAALASNIKTAFEARSLDKEVYSWAVRQRGRVFPWQGVRSLSQPYTPAPQEYFPDAKGNKIKIPGGLNLWRCDTTFFKSDLSHKLSIAPDDPGAFHLHANGRGGTGDGGILEQYAREMCAEVWDDEKQAWENPSGKPNHFWDCETMALALAFILNIRHRPGPEADAGKKILSQRPMPKHGGTSIADRLAQIRR